MKIYTDEFGEGMVENGGSHHDDVQEQLKESNGYLEHRWVVLKEGQLTPNETQDTLIQRDGYKISLQLQQARSVEPSINRKISMTKKEWNNLG